MSRLQVNVEKKKNSGKQSAKRLRNDGFIPGVVYGKGINSPISIGLEEFKVFKSINFSESTVIDLVFLGEKESKPIPVLIKSVQVHPLTNKVIHLDLLKVSLTHKIKVHLPVILKGEAKGKDEGAVLEQILREIEVEGLPLDIPKKLEVDISGLEVGHSIHAKDLLSGEKIKITTDPEATIAALVIKKEEEPEEGESEEEVSAEPEVIKEKKPAQGEEAQKKEKETEKK